MVGDCIKIARKKAGLTQEDLGKAIGMSGVAIMRYEKGQREPNKGVIEKIANVLGVNPNYLMDWDELYPDVAQQVKENENFISYLKSIGYDVVYFSEPCQIPIEEVPDEFKEDAGGQEFIEGETFSVVMTYEGESLTLSEVEFEQLQEETKESVDRQLWKIKKNQEK